MKDGSAVRVMEPGRNGSCRDGGDVEGLQGPRLADELAQHFESEVW
jgi:hypothetical protein